MGAGSEAGSRAAFVAEAADDLGSLRSKLESTAADRIFLILPGEARVLRTPLEFRVLARVAETLASEIVIVTGDGNRRRYARDAGFPTRRSPRGLLDLLPPQQAERYRFKWYRIWRWFPLVPLVCYLLLPGLVLATVGAGLALIPELRVTLASHVETDSALLDLWVDPRVVQPDVGGRRLPAIPLEHRFAVEASVPTTGRGRRPSGYARGTVIMVNGRDDIVRVPQGLVLVASTGAQFVTQQEVRLAPHSLRGQRVPIQALEPGPGGNVPAMAITRPLDAAPPGLALFNDQPTAGGSEEEYPEVAAGDFETLRAALLDQAGAVSRDYLAELAGDELTLLPESLRVEPVTEAFAPGLRVEAAEVQGRLTARATALAYSNDAFNRLAVMVWEASLPPGYHRVGDPPTFSSPEFLGYQDGAALFRIGVQGRVAPDLDREQLIARLRGRSLDEARAILEAWGGLNGPVAVELWPEWAPRALRVQLHVTLTE
ncbi:MAG: baseplate J/gp47 family protein [Chloroflexi bacterium]|nr:baseplate J/gp47 family protein [Chloroflexota bacterium]